MKPPVIPRAEDKVGLKIDYLAKRLALVLAPQGFKRQGRTLLAQAGQGLEQHWRIVHLQAGQWNEGPRGEFYVNLALQFPALTRMRAQQPRCEWMLDQVDKPDFAAGQMRERLESLLHKLPAGQPHAAVNTKIGRDTDLEQMADAVDAAMFEVGWPWLRAHASLKAVADYDDSLIVCDVPTRIAAAVAIGDLDAAQRVLDARAGYFSGWTASNLAALRTWLAGLGLDMSVLPTQPAPRKPSAYDEKRKAEERAEEAAHEAEAAAAQAKIDAGAPEPALVAQAWVAEYRARWRKEPAPLTDLPTGVRVAALAAEQREAVLVALMQQLVAAESTAHRDPLKPDPDEFELDETVRRIVPALLPTIGDALASTQQAVLDAMHALAGRIQPDLVTSAFPWPFVALVKWLERSSASRRALLKPAVRAWLDAFGRGVVARWQQTSKALKTAHAEPIDPNHPMAEFLLEARERNAEIMAQAPPVDDAEVLRRLSEYPEQALAGDDKRAVRSLRRWLLRDEASGALPVAFDVDDWGGPSQAAWDVTDPDLRRALTPVLQGWMEGVDAKPSQRWLRELNARIAALDAPLAPSWRDWMFERLHAFEHTSGRTEWATTGVRPGVGAKLGEASESLLMGVLWWAWCDAGIERDTLAATVRRVAEAAWLKLPEAGARAPVVGGLALRMLAGLGVAHRDELAARAAVKGAKQMKQAAERALADPVAGRSPAAVTANDRRLR
jgi:hypothetical protein